MLRWDLCVVGAFQVGSALGQVVGVRLLTEVLTPAVFGEASLLMGVAALITSTLVNPSMQALLRHYPAEARGGEQAIVEAVAIKNIGRTVKAALPVCAPLSLVAFLVGWVTPFDALLIAALVGVDGLRMFQTAILNATRQHRWYGIWQNGEAWGRPIVAYGAVTVLGVQADIVLASFAATSGLLYLMLRRKMPVSPLVSHKGSEAQEVLGNFKSYTVPLIPIGLIGWTSNMADRYMIGGLLSSKDVGTYVAVYGLASRPTLMLSSIAETAIRPAYYEALRQQSGASKKYIGAWFLISAFGSAVLWAGFALFHEEIASLLLGPAFRDGAYLAPWIAAGYGLLALVHITTRICFAHDATKSVLTSEAAGAVLSVVIGFPMIYLYGLDGAAMAVPVYFGMQFLLSAYLARRASGMRSVRSDQK
ncbi:MAG: polysaccharide biosynthesis C-terminal domain-containing protein [Nitrospira sp.]|nr:polysaccharide biosynthesis C-terminal domain-containing protein [Nitrospira sp.]